MITSAGRQARKESVFDNMLQADIAAWDCGIDTSDPYGVDRQWRHEIFSYYPEHIAESLSQEYIDTYENHGRHEATWNLSQVHGQLKDHVLPFIKHYDEVRSHENNLAHKYSIASSDRSPEQAILTFTSWVHAQGVELPTNGTAVGIDARLKDPAWWCRKLIKRMIQSNEKMALIQGKISKHKDIYISKEALRFRHEQKARAKDYLASMTAENEQGEKINLLDAAEHSLSNPRNRRAELMTIISGTEEYANSKGHIGVFITITCPSRMHAASAATGRINPKYDGTTPAEGQKYLTTIWARMRSKLKRDNVTYYGTRITEPQHDATPHWHMLLFVEPDQRNQLIETMRYYSLQEDGTEPGAQKYRFKAILIDKAKGTAAGYIAKYVSKNIDGYGLTEGSYGESPYDTAEKVEAWASIWSIRQFQHFGLPPVGVYRELRRHRKPINESKVLEECRISADEHDWTKFIELMGGIDVKRDERAVTISKCWSDQLGVYGEPKGDIVIGITDGVVTIITREHEWTIGFSPLHTGRQSVLCEASSAPLGHSPAGHASASARVAGVLVSRAENST